MDVGLKRRAPAKPTRPATFPLSAREASKVALWPRLIPAVLSGGLLWLCYFPVAWGWLAWVALTPLLCLVRAPAGGWKLYLSAWIGGLVFFVPALQWMRAGDHPMEYAWILLAIYCALYFPAAIYLIRRLERHTALPLMITVPLVWVALEWVRSFMLTGFSWYYLAHSQHDFLALIQISDITGAYGVSFMVAGFNAWLFELLYCSARFRDVCALDDESAAPAPSRSLWLQGAAIFGVAVGTFFYGSWRLEQESEFKPGPRIALLQSNLDQTERGRRLIPGGRRACQTKFIEDYTPLLQIARDGHLPRPDLIIWPETSFCEAWHNVQPPADPQAPVPEVPSRWLDGDREYRRMVVELLKNNFPAHHLLGLNSLVKDEHGRDFHYNTALLLDPAVHRKAVYHKNHRVPFGEYVPLSEWLPFLDHLSPAHGSYGIHRDDKFTRFAFGDYHFGVLICFEDTVPPLARRYHVAGDDGPAVDFLVNMSNDGWFNGTVEHEEHLAVSRFRAIECRRALVRSANMGISAVIDGNGRVQAPEAVSPWVPIKNWVVREQQGRIPDLPLSRWSEFKKVPGVIVATVPIDHRASFYAVWGDWLPWTCVALLMLCFSWPVISRRGKRPGSTVSPPHVGLPRVETKFHGTS